MKKLKNFTPAALICFALIMFGFIFCCANISCTQNQRVKKFGGTMEINLENEKLINVTWKDDHLWVLTKEMKATDILETYKFSEKSSFGILQGTIIFKEVKK